MGQSRKRRGNHQGTTYKVGASWRTVIQVDGRRISASASTQQESRRRAKARAEACQKSQVLGEDTAATQLTLREYFDTWLEHEHRHHIAYNTHKRYRGLADHHILPALGHLPLVAIRPSDVSRLLSEMTVAKQSPRSRQQARAVLSVALAAAVDKGLLTINPVAATKRIRVDRTPIDPLGEADVQRLLSASAGTYMHARLLIALCGLRQGEALGLRWRDIDFTTGQLRISNQLQKIRGVHTLVPLKTTRSTRAFPLPQTVVDALRAHLEVVREMRLLAGPAWAEHDYVFPRADGRAQDSTSDYRNWHAALDAAAIPRRNLHNARHTAATLLYSIGVDIETISRILGHSGIAITSRTYVHSAEAPLRGAADLMEEIVLKGYSHHSSSPTE